MSISANDSMDSSSTQGESGVDVGHGVKEVRLSYSFNGVSCMCNDYCMHACSHSKLIMKIAPSKDNMPKLIWKNGPTIRRCSLLNS